MICIAPDCDKKAGKHIKYCWMHYKRLERTGSLDLVKPRPAPRRGCSVPDCDRPHRAKGFCNSHYQQWKKGTLETNLNKKPPQCTVPGCDRQPSSGGLCAAHKKRKDKGLPLEGKPLPKQKRCARPNCNLPYYALDLCRKHYEAQRQRLKREKASTR